MKKRLMIPLATLCAMLLLGGCGANKPETQAPSASAAGETVQVNILNGWEVAIRTLAVSPAGKNAFGEDLLKDVSIESYATVELALPLPEGSRQLDLQVSDADGKTFLLTGLDLTNAKPGETANVELGLNADGTGSATHAYIPEDMP